MAYDAVVELLRGFLDEHMKNEAGAFARVTASPWWRDPVLGVSPLAKE